MCFRFLFCTLFSSFFIWPPTFFFFSFLFSLTFFYFLFFSKTHCGCISSSLSFLCSLLSIFTSHQEPATHILCQPVSISPLLPFLSCTSLLASSTTTTTFRHTRYTLATSSITPSPLFSSSLTHSLSSLSLTLSFLYLLLPLFPLSSSPSSLFSLPSITLSLTSFSFCTEAIKEGEGAFYVCSSPIVQPFAVHYIHIHTHTLFRYHSQLLPPLPNCLILLLLLLLLLIIILFCMLTVVFPSIGVFLSLLPVVALDHDIMALLVGGIRKEEAESIVPSNAPFPILLFVLLPLFHTVGVSNISMQIIHHHISPTPGYPLNHVVLIPLFFSFLFSFSSLDLIFIP